MRAGGQGGDGWRRTAKVFSIRPAAPRQQRDGQRLKNPFWTSGKVNDPWTSVEGDLGSYLRAVASMRQREVRVHQAARAHLPVNQLPRWESAGTPLKPIKNAAVVIWVAEWSIGRQELMVHGVHRRRDGATQCKGFHVDQRAHLDEAHVQQKPAVAIECSQHRSRDAGDPLGVLAPLHCHVKGTGERAVAIERQTDKDHVTTRTLRQPRYA